MDWYTHLESRRRAALIALFVLLVAALAVSAMRNNIDYDIFWHLRMGQDWVEKGLSPWQDHYSYTYEGAPIKSPPVLFDVTVTQVVAWLGFETGLKLFLFCCALLVIIAAAGWLRHIRAPVLVYCLVLPMIVELLQLRAVVRPELLSYTFSILALYLYDRARAGLTVANMAPVAILMLVWTNYHSSIFGYVIFFGLFLELGIKLLVARAPLRQWISWLAWGGVVVAAGFLNPDFSHPLISVLAFPAEWKALIQEYQSPLMYRYLAFVYILLFMTLVALVLSLRLRFYGYVAVVAVFSFYAASMARLVTPAGIVILCIFAHTMSSVNLKSWATQGSRLQRRFIATLAILLFLMPLIHSVIAARAFVRSNLVSAGEFPDQMIAYLKDSGKGGRIFNEYELGGFLLYHLAPDYSVFIDGRTEILYPVTHYQRLLAALQSADALRGELELYDIDYAVLKSSESNARLMSQAGQLQLDYADLRYFLYTRERARFPIAGFLWGQPYCWKAEFADGIAEERLFALLNLPPDSPLLPFIDFVASYVQSEDANEFLAQVGSSPFWTDSTKRFAGYQALNLGLFEVAKFQFENVTVQEPKDYLARAWSLLESGDPTGAENELDKAMRVSWANIEFIDVVILEALLEKIQEVQPLSKFETGDLDGLKQQVGDSALSRNGRILSAESFCVGS